MSQSGNGNFRTLGIRIGEKVYIGATPQPPMSHD